MWAAKIRYWNVHFFGLSKKYDNFVKSPVYSWKARLSIQKVRVRWGGSISTPLPMAKYKGVGSQSEDLFYCNMRLYRFEYEFLPIEQASKTSVYCASKASFLSATKVKLIAAEYWAQLLILISIADLIIVWLHPSRRSSIDNKIDFSKSGTTSKIWIDWIELQNSLNNHATKFLYSSTNFALAASFPRLSETSHMTAESQ